MASLNFNAAEVAPSAPRDPLPTGWYNMQITGSEMKPTNSGTGSYLQLELTVLSGQFQGRKVWDRLNLQNQNPVAVQIAQETLSAICHATGVMQVQDSSQLHGLPMEVKVQYKDAEGSYDASNDVKGYAAAGTGNVKELAAQGAPAGVPSMGGAPASAPVAAPAAAPQPAPAVQPAAAPAAQPAPAAAPAPAPEQQATPVAQPAAQPQPAAEAAPATAAAPQPAQSEVPAATAAPAGGGATPPWMNQAQQ